MSVGPSYQEIEIKLRAPDPAAAAELLTTHGFEVSKPRTYERNSLFDTESASLRSSGLLLRVREAGGFNILTFKGPSTKGRHKMREELELNLSDAHLFEQILKRLGYQRTFIYEKFRTEFEEDRGKGTATLDETPIGTFLELEGEGEWIDRCAAQLGFKESDYITASYGSLYREWCAEHRQTPADMVWPASPQAPQSPAILNHF